MPDGGRGTRPTAPEPTAFLRQLRSPAYVMDVRPADAPHRAAGRAVSRRGPPVPCLLALSRARDPELDAVGRLLRRTGVPCTRVNADELASLDLLLDPGRGAARVAGHWLAPTVTWIRHFSARAVEPQVTGHPAGSAGHLFVRDSWRAAACGLAAISGMTIRSGGPGLLAQFRLAARHGIEVPQTVATTDPSRVTDQFTARRVIVKALNQHFVEAAPGRLTGVFPAVLPRGGLSRWPEPGPPVIVQEYVEHEAELRVYYVDRQLHGFEIRKEAPADPWLDGSRVAARRVDLPAAVATAAKVLASAFGLRYGAFDFLVRDGSPVFLEVNPGGDWRWAELRSGCSPVTMAVARMLCDLHREQTAGQAREAPLPGAFSLLAFLAG
jgi:hypothetical protein